jgi:hypothetical protein
VHHVLISPHYGDATNNRNAGKMQEKMNVETEAIRAEMKANMNDGRKVRAACHEAMEADTEKTEPDPGCSIWEHEEVPKEEAAVMPED